MKIVVDENMPFVAPLFGDFADVVPLPGRTLSPEDVKDADALLVRSVTQVNSALLSGSQVSFVGSATIGTDHLDIPWLEQQGICWTNAPGCNALAVADYVVSSLYQLSDLFQCPLAERTFGIVGVGNVGRRVQQRLEGLGLSVLLCDPFRQENEPDQNFVSLDELLAGADTLCLHTPLTQSGAYPTYHLLGADELEKLKPGTWLLNAGRGPVIDNKALLKHCQTATSPLGLVLDVWEDEPVVDAKLAEFAHIATPHIAGYSLDGKARGTFMLYEALCDHIGRVADKRLADLLPALTLDMQQFLAEPDAVALMQSIYSPKGDDQRFRASLLMDNQPEAFDQLRKTYPVRREFGGAVLSGTAVGQLLAEQPALHQQLMGMGFQVVLGSADQREGR